MRKSIVVALSLLVAVGIGAGLPASVSAQSADSKIHSPREGLKKKAKKDKKGNQRAVAPRPADESPLAEEMIIYFRSSTNRQVSGVTYGAGGSTVELFDARVAVDNRLHDYSALQVRLPATRAADMCAQAALVTQRVQALGPDRKDITFIVRGTLENNGVTDDEGIVEVKELRSCFFQ